MSIGSPFRVACLVVAFSCLGHAFSVPQRASSEDFLALAIRGAEMRERALNGCQLLVTSLSREPGGVDCLVRARLQFPREEWVRVYASVRIRDEVLKGAEAVLLTDTVQPGVSVYDGGRTLEISRDKRWPELWSGTLREGLERDMRRGPLPCGLVFGEQWLSVCLREWQLDSVEDLGDAIRLRFTTGSSPVMTSRVAIDFDQAAGMLPTSVRWTHHRSGETSKLYEATVKGRTLAGGVVVPSSSQVSYHYGHDQFFDVSICYSPLAPEESVGDTSAVPSLVQQCQGVVLYRDELTSLFACLGDPARLPDHLADVPGSTGAFRSRRGGWSVPWMALVPVGVLLMVWGWKTRSARSGFSA